MAFEALPPNSCFRPTYTLPSHLHLPLPGGTGLVPNPGCPLPGRLMWGNRKERGWPEWHGVQGGHWARQVMMMEDQRLLLLHLHLFLHLLLVAVYMDLGVVQSEEGR